MRIVEIFVFIYWKYFVTAWWEIKYLCSFILTKASVFGKRGLKNINKNHWILIKIFVFRNILECILFICTFCSTIISQIDFLMQNWFVQLLFCFSASSFKQILADIYFKRTYKWFVFAAAYIIYILGIFLWAIEIYLCRFAGLPNTN